MSTPTPTHTAVQLPRLPAGLLNLLGEYSMAREDFGVGTPGALDVWQRLIAAIKEYAADQVKAAVLADRDSRTSSVAPGGLPLQQADSKEGFGDSVSAQVEPPGATLSPCAASQWISTSERMPEPDSGEVLVWLTGGRCRFDEWATYREDPTGLGGPTMDMGVMWRDHEFEEVMYWARITPPTPQVDRGESSSEGGES